VFVTRVAYNCGNLILTNFVGYNEVPFLERYVGCKLIKGSRPLKPLCTVHINVIILKSILNLLHYETINEIFCIKMSWNSRLFSKCNRLGKKKS